MNTLPRYESGEGYSIATNWFYEQDTRILSYELTEKNQKRLVKGNTYNIKFDKIYGEFNSNRNIPDDYRVIENDVAVNKRETIGSLNCYDAVVKDEYKDDYQILQLINRNQKIQLNAIFLLIDSEKKQNGPKNEDIKKMINMLSNGEPVMLGITAKEGGHSVLGTKISKEKEEDIYYLYLYDSNAPGEDSVAKLTTQVSKEENKINSKYTVDFNSGGFEFYKFGISDIQ